MLTCRFKAPWESFSEAASEAFEIGDLEQAAVLYAEAGTIYNGIFGRSNLVSGMISRLLSEIAKASSAVTLARCTSCTEAISTEQAAANI